MPIGNVTSQILANIYLNELDRYVKHSIRPKGYMRYGDDFIVISDGFEWLELKKAEITDFLRQDLGLKVNMKNDIVVKSKQHIKFLGVNIFPGGRRLTKNNWIKLNNRVSLGNLSSYFGLVFKHCDKRKKRYFNGKINRDLERIYHEV